MAGFGGVVVFWPEATNSVPAASNACSECIIKPHSNKNTTNWCSLGSLSATSTMSSGTIQNGANMDVDEGFLPPPAPISAAPSPSTSTKHKIERSCITCHQRKIRCDKKSPCANCARHDLFCCYPEPERAGRRPPKTTIADVATRVSRLERTITALTKELPRDTTRGLNSSTTPPPEDRSQKKNHPGDAGPAQEILLQDGDSSRYVNEYLLSRVLDEVIICLSAQIFGSNNGFRRSRISNPL